MILSKIRQYVKRIVTRQEKTHRSRKVNPAGEKSQHTRVVLVQYGQGDLVIVGVA